MARTTKAEYSTPDGWHVTKRLERKARPAGRHARALSDALAELAELDQATTYRTAPAA